MTFEQPPVDSNDMEQELSPESNEEIDSIIEKYNQALKALVKASERIDQFPAMSRPEDARELLRRFKRTISLEDLIKVKETPDTLREIGPMLDGMIKIKKTRRENN